MLKVQIPLQVSEQMPCCSWGHFHPGGNLLSSSDLFLPYAASYPLLIPWSPLLLISPCDFSSFLFLFVFVFCFFVESTGYLLSSYRRVLGRPSFLLFLCSTHKPTLPLINSQESRRESPEKFPSWVRRIKMACAGKQRSGRHNWRKMEKEVHCFT